MNEFLFDAFDPVSAKQWKQKIQYDLKGADYNQTLVWQSPEGINVKPFYHRDDFDREFLPIPGHPESWRIGQHVFIDDPSVANGIARDAINRGAEAIIFEADKVFDIKEILRSFPFGKCAVYFRLNFLSTEFINKLNSTLSHHKAVAYFNIDPVGKLARTGNWFTNEKDDLQVLREIMAAKTVNNLIGVDASIYQNAGANVVQQLAYALAHANEYLNLFKAESDAFLSDLKITFKVAVGPNYFFEIAKIRAIRVLYAQLAKEYGVNEHCHIVAGPSLRNMSIYDYNVNMLRTTTESMSAVLGGADTVFNLPYDVLFHKSNEFGERIARNQLLILKNESYFDKVANPADGAYYIEAITDDLASKALEIFKDIEKGGGFISQLKSGTIQKKIRESADREQQQYESGDLKILGINYHPNKNDRMKGSLEIYPFLKHNPVKTTIEPIIAKRLSDSNEQQRLNLEL